jgi:hypothetical protein
MMGKIVLSFLFFEIETSKYLFIKVDWSHYCFSAGFIDPSK